MDFSEVCCCSCANYALASEGGGCQSCSSLLICSPPGCVQCMAETDNPNKCIEQREDYFECLHHRKEVQSPPHTSSGSSKLLED